MKTTQPAPRTFEFCFPEKDTLLRVEEAEETVVIRATRDSFSQMRKASFIRELVAEGFISVTHQWFSVREPEAFMGVQWLIDISWLKLPDAALAQARRFMKRILFGGCLLWLALMVGLFQGSIGNAALVTISKSRPAMHLSALANPFANGEYKPPDS